MPKQTRAAAVAAWLTITQAALLIAGCSAPPAAPLASQPTALTTPPFAPPLAMSADAQFTRLATDITPLVPDTGMLAAPPGACGPDPAQVVHLVVPERVLFASASDQPGPDAATALDAIADLTTRDVPGAALTVLGHTDAVGSDAYNLDLSKRRAETVLQGLVARGFDPTRVSAIAIGKRQPIADNATPAGRARNRRVEFLVSRCLAANLGVVAGMARARALLAADEQPNEPVEVLRLDPAGAYGMAPMTAVLLRSPDPEPPLPAALRATSAAQPIAAPPPVAVARPAPPPHYQPRTLSPVIERNPLGPAVPF